MIRVLEIPLVAEWRIGFRGQKERQGSQAATVAYITVAVDLLAC